MKSLSISTLSILLFAACGDDSGARQDAAVNPDADEADAMVDAPPAPLTWPTPVAATLSTAGPDLFMSATPGPSGTFYAAGYRATTATGPRMITVAKLTAAGALDTTFAGVGYFESTLEFRGGNGEIQVAVQSDGKVVVAGTIADLLEADDRDIGLFRVDASGALDTINFGTAGYSRVNLSAGFDDGGSPWKATDALRALAVGPSDALFIHAISRNDTANDGDFTVARLTAAGVLDTANYGTGGKHFVELNETNGVAIVRGMRVLADGSVIAGGYASTASSNGKPQSVLYKVLPDGSALDDTFATDGLYHEILMTDLTEIYGIAIDGNNITTAGYGHELVGAPNVWASLRFNLADGVRSTTFGGAADGVVILDPSGTLAGTNCRNAIALPGGRTALVGSTGGANSRNAAIAILAQDGQLDTTYQAGFHVYDFGTGEDQLWDGAVSGGKLLLAGWKGPATQTDVDNNDAMVVIIDLP